jgi:hypothetical protein
MSNKYKQHLTNLAAGMWAQVFVYNERCTLAVGSGGGIQQFLTPINPPTSPDNIASGKVLFANQ